MSTTFNIYNKVKVNSPYSNIDYYYGPYNNLNEAISTIKSNRRKKGLTVGILDETFGIREYWWAKGTDDDDLVLKENKVIPTLQYNEEFPETEEIRLNKDENKQLSFVFNTSSIGQVTYQIKINNTIAKTIKGPSGTVHIDIDTTKEGRFQYEITAVDSSGVSSSNSLFYTIIIGGITLKDNFIEKVLNNSEGLNTNTDIEFSIEASTVDPTKKICYKYTLLNSNNGIIKQYSKVANSNEIITTIQIGNLSKNNYTLKISAYEEGNEDQTITNTYTFEVLNPNEFYINISKYTQTADTRSNISINYSIISGTSKFFDIYIHITDQNGDIYKTFNQKDVQNNKQYVYSLNITNAGTYSISIVAKVGEEQNSAVINNINITEYIANYNIITQGLISYFKAQGKSNNNNNDTQGKWVSELNDDYIFELHNLNYNTNGWKNIEDSKETYLQFTGDSYGILKKKNGNTYSNYSPLNVLKGYENTGFTCEVIFKTVNIGVFNTKALSLYKDENSLSSGLSVSYDKLQISSKTNSRHIDITDNEWIHATFVINKNINTNPEKQEDYSKYKLVSIYINGSQCSASRLDDSESFEDSDTAVLNCSYNNGNIGDFGNCEIKSIRFYDRPLASSEVVNNYIASIYDNDQQLTISGRNENVLPIVHFIRMTDSDPRYTENKQDNHTFVKFSDLNDMTNKAQQKIRYVRGKMVYKQPGKDDILYPYVVVQTQGTSSLLYPVKNYKVIFYKNPEETGDIVFHTKKKIKFKEDWEEDSAYTLKCDYMEAAHLNNTPTASYYDHIIDTLHEEGIIDYDNLSPAKQETITSKGTDDPKYYYDAVKGFPCIVYYYETEEDYNNSNGTYVGSYMFNLDKSAKSLGFEVAKECQSFEGTSNTDGQAAGTFCKYETWRNLQYANYVNKAYNAFKIANPDIKYTLYEFIYNYEDKNIQYSSNGYIDSNFKDYGFLKNKTLALDGNDTSDTNRLDNYQSEYAYMANDFEARYDYEDREEGEEGFWGTAYDSSDGGKGLLRMLTWVSDKSEKAGTSNDEFKAEFNNYFNYYYCALYLLQTIFMGQVDNLGKNAMWDSWDGNIWYPRPYDLDSMAGLDNTGFERINPDAEIGIEFSPTHIFGGTVEQDSGIAVDNDGIPLRYKSYNTRDSRFWTSFLKSFRTELETLYNQLRNLGLYNIDNIINFYKSMTSDIIGETYYNKDMVIKFIEKPSSDTYLSRLHGNRILKFKSWLQKRLIFCDTYFKYQNSENSLNTSISFRANKSDELYYFVVKTYSPQYIELSVGSKEDALFTVYCSPDSKHINPYTKIQEEGILLAFNLSGVNKEISLRGAGNIKELPSLSDSNPSSLDLGGAKKLTSLVIQNSNYLEEVTLSTNTFLQTLDLRGCSVLGTGNGKNSIDVSKCPYLKNINIQNTKITEVTLPIGGSIQTFKANDSGLKTFKGDSLYLLKELDISNNKYITDFEMINCPQIESLELKNLPLQNIAIQQCKSLSSIDLSGANSIVKLTINQCDNLKTLSLEGSKSSGIKTISLQTLPSLTSLDIRNSSVSTLYFPDNHPLQNLKLQGSEIKKVVGITDSSQDDYLDFNFLNNLQDFTLYNCSYITNIRNFNTNVKSQYFYNNLSLKSIKGVGMNGISSCSYLFYGCTNLENININTFDFYQCTSLSLAFCNTPKLPYNIIRNILNNCKDDCNLSYLCYNKGVYDTNDPLLTTLSSKFFGNCYNTQNLTLAFYNSGLTNYYSNTFQSNTTYGSMNTKTITGMLRSTKITTTNNILTKFTEVENAEGVFAYTQVTAFSKNLLATNTKLLNIKGMFLGCSQLQQDISDYHDFFKNNTRINNAELLFRSSKITGKVPTGFLSYFTESDQVSLEGMFANTNLSDIEGPLFVLGNAIYTPKLKIGGLFSDALKTTGVRLENIFKGVQHIETAGESTAKGLDNSPIKDYNQGVFANCTGIISVVADIFDNFKLCKTIQGFFRNCSNLELAIDYSGNFDFMGSLIELQQCTNFSYVFSGCKKFTFGNISEIPLIFANNKNIIYINNMFEECLNIEGFNPGLLQGCNKLQNASYLFYKCSNLTQKNFEREGYLKDIFKGCSALKNVRNMFAHSKLNYYEEGIDSEYTINIPNGLFKDCAISLEDAYGMFENCEYIKGEIEQDKDEDKSWGLFQDCLKLKTTANFFKNCYKLTGEIPENIFKVSNNEDKYKDLTDISYMFSNCYFNKVHAITRGENTSYYLIHPNTFKKLPYVENISGLLLRTYTQPENTYQSNYDSTEVNSYLIDGDTFKFMYTLKNISNAFERCSKLVGNISNLFANSVNSITDASRLFAHTNITEIQKDFLLNSSGKNTALFKAYAMLYNCSKIITIIPEIWNRTIFTNISSNYDNRKGYCHSVDVINSSFDNLSDVDQKMYKQNLNI